MYGRKQPWQLIHMVSTSDPIYAAANGLHHRYANSGALEYALYVSIHTGTKENHINEVVESTTACIQ